MPNPFARLAKAAMLALPLALGLAAADVAPARAKGCEDLAAGRCKVTLPGGIAMAYVETGPPDGPAVILLHSLTDNIRSWSATLAALHRRDPGLHILAVDLRGHGESSMPPRAACSPAPEKCFRPGDFAGDIVAFMKAKKIAKATLAGHALGSFVVQEMALAHPELVERAVLVASAAKGVGNAALRDYVMKEPVEGAWKKALEAKGWIYPGGFYMLTPLKADPKAEGWLAKNWVVDPAADPAFLKPYLPETAKVRLGTWIGATRALLATDNTERLKGLSVPVLVIWATQDSIFLEVDQAALKQALGEAARAKGIAAFWKRYGVKPLPASGAQVSDIGHNLPWDAPDAVAADIDAFIKTGAPTADLVHSDKPPALDHIVTEPGKAEILKLGQPAAGQ